MAITITSTVIFGVGKALPLKGFPNGELSIIQSPKDFTKVAVIKDGKTRNYYVKEEDGYWLPFGEIINKEEVK